jgi:hypothetical protein
MSNIQELMSKMWVDDNLISKHDPKVNLTSRFMSEISRVEGRVVKARENSTTWPNEMKVSMVSFIVKVILGRAYIEPNLRFFKDLAKMYRDMIKIIGTGSDFYFNDLDTYKNEVSMSDNTMPKKMPINTFMDSELCFTAFSNYIIMKKDFWSEDTPYFSDKVHTRMLSSKNPERFSMMCTICDLGVRKKIESKHHLPYWDLKTFFCSEHISYMKNFKFPFFDSKCVVKERVEVDDELVNDTFSKFGKESLEALATSDMSLEVLKKMDPSNQYLLELVVMSMAHFKRMYCTNPCMVTMARKVYDLPLEDWFKWMKDTMMFWIKTYYFSYEETYDWNTAMNMVDQFDRDWDKSEAFYKEDLHMLFYEFKRRVIYRIKADVHMRERSMFFMKDTENKVEKYVDSVDRRQFLKQEKINPRELKLASMGTSHSHEEWNHQSASDSNGMVALVMTRDG